MLAFAAALAAGGSAAAGNGGLLPVDPVSPNGESVTQAYVFVLVLTGAIFLLVEGVLLAFVIKYRRGRRPRTAEGPQIHGSSRLEALWTIGPVLVLAAIAAFVFYELPSIRNAPAAAAADQTRIVVEGHQFYWLFRYPNGAVSIGTMVAPADTVVHETVVAPDNDVNHSWWVPAFGPKMDAIPGKVNETWFKAPEGEYVARCAELCGVQHAKMDAMVRVVPRAEYDAFIAQRKTDTAALGKEEFEHVCLVCHRLDRRLIGPPLAGNPVLTDPVALRAAVKNGVLTMPAVGHNWTEQQIEALLQYAKTLPGASGGQG